MPQLDNPRHEAFAQAVASGMKGAAAYRKVYGEHQRNARSSASALLKDNPDVSQRVSEISLQAAKGTVLTLQQEMEWLTKVVQTPISQIDEENVLCQRFKYTKEGRELWMVDKLGAMRLLADLKKELSDKTPAVSVEVNVTVMSSDRRKELQEKKRAAIERGLAQRN